MAKYIVLGVVILNLALFSPCGAMQAITGGGAAQNAGQISSPVPSAQMEVVNIAVDRIEDGAIYSRDGRKFDISGAKVIDNTRPEAGVKGAELDFENGSLVEVVLK